eukprot:6192853-Pleurochrysis_carterae.AAC.1
MYRWTVPYKWGHPAATFPVTNGTIRHTHRMTEILRLVTPSPGTSPICRVPIQPSRAHKVQPDFIMCRPKP